MKQKRLRDNIPPTEDFFNIFPVDMSGYFHKKIGSLKFCGGSGILSFEEKCKSRKGTKT